MKLKVIYILFYCTLIFFGCKESKIIIEPEEEIIDLPAKLDSAKVLIITPINNQHVFRELSVEIRVLSNSTVQFVRLYINNKTDSTLILYNSPYNFVIDCEKNNYSGAIEIYAEVFANHIFTYSGIKKVIVEKFSAPFLSVYTYETKINLLWQESFSFEDGHILERKKNDDQFEVLAIFPSNITQYEDIPHDTTATFTYRVRSFMDSLYSPYSNSISVRSRGKYQVGSNPLTGANQPNQWGDRVSPMSVNKRINLLGLSWENTSLVGFLNLDTYRSDVYTKSYFERFLSVEASTITDNFWCGTSVNKIYEMNKFNNYQKGYVVQGDSIISLKEDVINNRLIYGTVSGYLGAVDISSKTMHFYEKVSDNEITDIIVTTSGSIYYSIEDQCLYKFDPSTGLSDCINFGQIITTLLSIDDKVFIGTQGGDLFVGYNTDEIYIGNLQKFHLHNGKIWDLDYSERRLLSYGEDGKLLLSLVDEFEGIKTAYIIPLGPFNKKIRIASSQDNKTLLLSSDRNVYSARYIQFWEKI